MHIFYCPRCLIRSMHTIVYGTYVRIYVTFQIHLPCNIPHVISGVNFVGNTSVEAENSSVNRRDINPQRENFLCAFMFEPVNFKCCQFKMMMRCSSSLSIACYSIPFRNV